MVDLNRNVLAWICLALAMAFFVVGLWPMNFRPANKVRWQADGSGLRFEQHGMAFSPHPLVFNEAKNKAESVLNCTVELWLQAATEPSNGFPHIVTFYDGRIPESFSLGQWKSSIILRAPTPGRKPVGAYREAGIWEALPAGRLRLVTVSCGAEGTAFYLDGVASRHFPKFFLPPDAWQGSLILGSSAGGHPGWEGTLLGVALINRALSPEEIRQRHGLWASRDKEKLSATSNLAALYVFDQISGAVVGDQANFQSALIIPKVYQVLHNAILSPPWTELRGKRYRMDDITINILGFVPFGFFFFLYRRPSQVTSQRPWIPLLGTVGLATAISVAIEFTQVFLPCRSSSLLDLLCNSGGALLGALVALWGGRLGRAASNRSTGEE